MEKKNLLMVALVTVVAIGLVLSVTAIARGAIQAIGVAIDMVAG